MRICSFFPTATEMLYALGLGRSVVGRSQHCNFPPQVRRKPVVVESRVAKIAKQDSLSIHRAVLKLRQQGTHQFTVDVRALNRLKPDIVITQNLCSVCAASHPEVSAALRHVSPYPKVLTLQARRFDEVFTELKRLGDIANREEASHRLLTELQKRIDRVRGEVSQATHRPRVFCCEWLEPLMAAGHWIPELVELAGGIDGLGRKGEDSVWLSWERIRAYDPEVIVVMPCSYSMGQSRKERYRLLKRPGWRSLSAVRQERVFTVDTGFYHHAGPRLVQGLELFAHLFHPDLVPAGPLRRHFRKLD